MFQTLFARHTWTETIYVLAKLPLSFAGFVFVVISLALGSALTVTFIGLPLLASSGLAARTLGSVHRRLARALLDERVEAPPPFARGPGFLGWLQSALRDAPSWRARAYLLATFPLAVVTFSVAAVLWGVGLFWLLSPIWWQRTGIKAALLALNGLAMVLAAPWIVGRLIWLDRVLIRGWLGPSPSSQRVSALEAARAHVVKDAAATLRRIERDLHDGTQAQLATLAMTIGQAKEKLEQRPDVPFDPDGALDLIDTAHQHAKEALAEVRDLARGILPPALDVGLDTALATLVQRSPVPATLRTEIPVRPERSIEAIAYFTVAELLANVAKHSHAHHARVDVVSKGEALSLRVCDDGLGGALPGGGSGLMGLVERVRAVDGQLRVSSPEGGPTVIDVELPLRA
ncbi:MAG: sensor histidine kinase [Acidimicrobiia bacterium]